MYGGQKILFHDVNASSHTSYIAQAKKHESYYLEGIEKLKDRSTRCIELKGEYIEK